MKEVHKYIANDGTEFDDKSECIGYELACSHDGISDIKFYDSDENQLTLGEVCRDGMSGTYKVIINNENQYKAFREVSDANCWMGSDDITAPGIWKYIEEAECFLRLDNMVEEFIGQIKWERDEAMRMLEDIGLSIGHKYIDLTDDYKNWKISNVYVSDLLENGNVRFIQIGGFE